MALLVQLPESLAVSSGCPVDVHSPLTQWAVWLTAGGTGTALSALAVCPVDAAHDPGCGATIAASGGSSGSGGRIVPSSAASLATSAASRGGAAARGLRFHLGPWAGTAASLELHVALQHVGPAVAHGAVVVRMPPSQASALGPPGAGASATAGTTATLSLAANMTEVVEVPLLPLVGRDRPGATAVARASFAITAVSPHLMGVASSAMATAMTGPGSTPWPSPSPPLPSSSAASVSRSVAVGGIGAAGPHPLAAGLAAFRLCPPLGAVTGPAGGAAGGAAGSTVPRYPDAAAISLLSPPL